MTVTAFRQRTPEWHAERQTGVGSSDAPIIAGVSKWGDVRSLWAEKAGFIDTPVIETNPMRWGRLLEAAIASAYTEETGREVRRVHLIRRHRKHRFMLASLDRVTRKGKRIVEIKTQGFSHEGWGQPGTDEIPDVYRVQVQHQLAVTGYDVADVPVLFGGSDFRLFTIPRDDELIAALVEMEAAFWRHVEAKTPPPPADRYALSVALRPDERDPDDYLTDLIRRGAAAREALSAAKVTSDELDAKVKAGIGEWAGVRGLATLRQNKPAVKVDWRLIAAGYRKALEERSAPGSLDAVFPGGLDTFESLFTQSVPGNRPLRYLEEEFGDDSPIRI